MPCFPRLRIKLIGCNRTVGDFLSPVDLQNLILAHALQEIAHAQHDDRMADDQNTLATIITRNGVDHAAQPQDHIAPTLAAWRTMVELAQNTPELGLIRKLLSDTKTGQAIKDTELLLAQALVADKGQVVKRKSGTIADDLGGCPCPHIGRANDHAWTLVDRHLAEPAPQRRRLILAKLG